MPCQIICQFILKSVTYNDNNNRISCLLINKKQTTIIPRNVHCFLSVMQILIPSFFLLHEFNHLEPLFISSVHYVSILFWFSWFLYCCILCSAVRSAEPYKNTMKERVNNKKQNPDIWHLYLDGWIGTEDLGCFQFLISEVNLNWVEAQQKCESVGGYLAEPLSAG